MEPRFPIYIPSKSRAEIATTPRFLDKINLPYKLVIEEQQFEEYNKFFSKEKLLILDPIYKKTFNPLMEMPEDKSLGAGPSRNFIWDHSISEGHEWHWTMDDNILLFAILNKNNRHAVGDGTIFHAMEEFVLRYKNIGMAGPNYWTFAHPRAKRPPITINTRIYSCNLIRNDLPYRWRGRYNEDTILSLDMLTDGWCTVQFNTMLQDKMHTQVLTGGNTEAFYAEEGTYPKSKMLKDLYPNITKIVWRFKRWHHHVNYKVFTHGLIKKDDIKIEEKKYNFKPQSEIDNGTKR